MMQPLKNNKEISKEGKLNEVIHHVTKRPNGTIRIQQDFEFCPTQTEQHTSHLSDVNYLMEKYRPDELAAYIAARNSHRQEILGHDFSREPDLQGAMNATVQFKKFFNNLPEEIRNNFRNHVEFLKFIDNDKNAETLVKLGLLKPKEILKAKEITAGTTQEAPKADPPATENLPKQDKP